ncbi:MAG TPA: family 16 glycoside hydrolase [Phycisphaerae bacterium]|nr:family 16 glycoside hydrolase [Phycisphaerae bacterium]
MRTLCLSALIGLSLCLPARSEPAFRKHVIDSEFRAEAVAAADINRDGRLDLVAGECWYESPDFKPHKFRTVEMRDGYADVRFDVPEDINGDGWIDIATCHRGPVLEWLENPKGEDRLWTGHKVGESVSTEPMIFVDLDGDGRGDYVGATEPRDITGCALGWWKPGVDPRPSWTMQVIGKQIGCDHGIGVGDINRDGRLDVLTGRAYYEAPAKPANGWKRYPFERSLTHQAVVCDFDGDGDQDVAGGCPHDYGLFWYEQVPGPEGKKRPFARHTIDGSISQLHALVTADIDGDGDLDLVTGKRYKAHAGGDPGTDDPALLVWYELTRKDGKATFTRHVIDDDSGVGYAVSAVDFDGDGDVDVLVSNKKGVFFFEQTGKHEMLPLFDGKTLDNWIGDKTLWRVENGAIVGRTETGLKHNSFLVTRDHYDNFVLTLDVKLVPDNANSGIQFRSAPREDGECVGYQADIGQKYWGSIYEEQGRGMLHSGFEGKGEFARIPEAWNHYVVYAVGDELRVEINGTVCTDIRDSKTATGVIGLQVHSGGPTDVWFRNIRLRKTEKH